jgi:two-component system CheB/CheR fusion protein
MLPKKSTSPRQTRRPAIHSQSDRKSAKIFPIVGIGASAGGLKAFEKFFDNMPPDSGIGFVLIPHLDPSHVSMLPDLLKKYTRMPVVQAEDGMKVERNHVHVIPPNTEMVIMGGTLLLKQPKEPRGLRLPIDIFLRSLAEDRREKAICIILSGNGTDGTMGLKAIKAELGMAMAQEPSSAEYDGMPRNAVETGMVDYVLPPDRMPAELIAYVKRLVSRGPPKTVADAAISPESLPKIFQVLRSKTGHDFSCYKIERKQRNTIQRVSRSSVNSSPDCRPFSLTGAR